MKKVLDFFIVGLGVAGACFARECLVKQKSFRIFDAPQIASASSIAAGVYNPVVLKRFTPIWDAESQLTKNLAVFRAFEAMLGEKFRQDYPIFRVLNDEKEADTWRKKSVREDLKAYLHPTVLKNSHPAIQALYGLGRVSKTGRIDLRRLLVAFANYLSDLTCLENSNFDFSQLTHNPDDTWTYGDFTAKNLLFSDGISALKNPFFPKSTLHPNKGEVLHIRTEKNLNLQAIYKGACFLMPLSDANTYYVGATYDRHFTTPEPSTENREKLEEQLQRFLLTEYEVIGHYTNLRPTTSDHRPLVGEWKKGSGIYFLNGMGSRGTLLAPKMANLLFEHACENKALPAEVDIARFR